MVCRAWWWTIWRHPGGAVRQHRRGALEGAIADALLAATGLTRFYERSDTVARVGRALSATTGRLRGSGETALTIREHDWRLTLDIATGHKTGYYLDQRDSRQRFAEAVRQFGCQRVLNCFSYTGGFSVAALAGGAQR